MLFLILLLLVQQWLESLGIDSTNAERYAQGLARRDIGYTSVSQLTSINEKTLVDAGVDVGRHRNEIMQAVLGTDTPIPPSFHIPHMFAHLFPPFVSRSP